MEFRTAEGQERYDAVVARLGETVVGLDFDGTLSPIVDDPDQARVHPHAGAVLTALVGVTRAVALVTGRPVEQVRRLGDLDAVADAVADGGGRLLVLGQYGNERWSSDDREVRSPEPPEGLAGFRDELPAILAASDADGAHVEEKGLAVAVHTRRLPDPAAAQERLAPTVREAAERHGLVLEPGRMVLEVRAPGVDKGGAVRTLHEELAPAALVFAGDDLGDLEAFAAVEELRSQGVAGLLVCSGSTEQAALVERADLVVDGPEGVVEFLDALVRAASSRS